MKKAILWITSNSYQKQWQISAESCQKYLPDWEQINVKIEELPEVYKTEYGHYTDIGQYICAIRPRVIKDYFNTNKYSHILFLGADVVFFQEPGWFEDIFKYNAVVTPHITMPYEYIDNTSPNFHGILKTGHINSDFVLWSNNWEIIDFLNWQAEIHKNHCTFQWPEFLDQQWLNCLPFFVNNVKILRSESYNVAYWNFEQRGLFKDYFGWYSVVNKLDNELPMVCFQFSGFIPGQPEKISKYYTRSTNNKVILELMHWYDEELRK